MSTSCPSCFAAEATPTSDRYSANCTGCMARALAATGAHLLPREQYREAVRKVFGEKAQEGHEGVREWAQRLRQQKARTA